MSNKKFLILVLVILVVSLLTFHFLHPKPIQQTIPPKPPSLKSISYANSLPPEALDTATRYLQAREDAIGAGQPSLDTWLTAVQSLTTSTWFSQLRATSKTSTPEQAKDYSTTHTKKYIIKAVISDCFWNEEAMKSTPSEGIATCKLTDSTVNQATGIEIPADQLTSGWSHNGQQLPPNLHLIKQANSWLVSDDQTGQAG